MKKHEIIKFAYDNYPKGTKFIGANGIEFTSNGAFEFPEELNITDVNLCSMPNGNIYLNGKWAEIVKPKIAVKVDNEKEFKALMKYYDSLGYSNPYMFVTFPEKRVKEDGFLLITFEDNYVYPHVHYGNHENLNPENYQIIPFSEFAEQKGIKLPLLTSEDGVDLYEGDAAFPVKDNEIINQCEYAVTKLTINGISRGYKYFSTKQAALDWIEAQKPKNIIISPDSGYPIIVYRKPVCGDEYIHLDMSNRGDYNGRNIHLTIDELRQAVKAYDKMHS